VHQQESASGKGRLITTLDRIIRCSINDIQFAEEKNKAYRQIREEPQRLDSSIPTNFGLEDSSAIANRGIRIVRKPIAVPGELNQETYSRSWRTESSRPSSFGCT
jgi:hypothetical protein